MKLTYENENNQPLMMRDVYSALVGHVVTVYLVGGGAIVRATLQDHNGAGILKLTDTCGSTAYVHTQNVAAIMELAVVEGV